jgi:hypothetical protein
MGKPNATDVSNRYCLKVIGCSRLTVPPNCSTPFWDPIGGKCLCSATSCNFNDDSRPIGVRVVFLFVHSGSGPQSIASDMF